MERGLEAEGKRSAEAAIWGHWGMLEENREEPQGPRNYYRVMR